MTNKDNIIANQNNQPSEGECINDANLIVKSHKLIEGRYSLTLNEYRLFTHILSKIARDDSELYEYTVPFDELVRNCGIDSADAYKNNGALIKAMSVKMIEQSLQMYVPNKQTGVKQWTAFSIFETATITENKEIVYKLSNALKPYLLGLKEQKKAFTKIEKQYIYVLASTYSVRLYEYALSKLTNKAISRSKASGQKFKSISKVEYEMPIDELRYKLILEKKYTKTKDFRRYVLDKACKEITEKTNISLNYTCIPSTYDKRKVGSIKFSATRKIDIGLPTSNIQDVESPISNEVQAWFDNYGLWQQEVCFNGIQVAIEKGKITTHDNPNDWFLEFFGNWEKLFKSKKTETGVKIRKMGAYIKSLIEDFSLLPPSVAESKKDEEERQIKIAVENKKQELDKSILKIISSFIEKNHSEIDNSILEESGKFIQSARGKMHFELFIKQDFEECATVSDFVSTFHADNRMDVRDDFISFLKINRQKFLPEILNSTIDAISN
jgi:plasmid replication initiation protein